MSQDPHITTSYDTELDALRGLMARLGSQVDNQFQDALQGLAERNAALAAQVIAADHDADALQQGVDEKTVRVLALRSPVADDLRVVFTSLKVAAELERIGDLAANIAKRTLVLSQLPPVKSTRAVVLMGQLVGTRIRSVIEAHLAEDAEAAMGIWQRDEEIDELYTGLFREIVTSMMESARNITASTHLVFIAKSIERCGDHATNIAEMTHFLVRGTRLAALRPKRDLSASMPADIPGPCAA